MASKELIAYYEKRLLDEQKKLRDLDSLPRFRIVQHTEGGGEIDITEQTKQGLRDAITDYRQIVELLRVP